VTVPRLFRELPSGPRVEASERALVCPRRPGVDAPDVDDICEYDGEVYD
jgi:hypothetical protein